MAIIFIPVEQTLNPSDTGGTFFSELYGDRLTIELGTDDSTRLFTTARRKTAINDGVKQFVDITECLVTQSTIASSHGVGEYNLLSTNMVGGSFWRLAKQRPEYQLVSSGASSAATVTYISGDIFQRRDPEWLNQYEPGWRQSTAGTPRYYYERLDGGRRYFGLYPPPEIASSESGKVVLSFVNKPETMTADGDRAFTVNGRVRTDLDLYAQAAVHWGAHWLEKLRMNTEASQTQLQIFLGYCEKYLQSKRPKGGTTLKQARSYFAESRSQRGVDLPKPMAGWNY